MERNYNIKTGKKMGDIINKNMDNKTLNTMKNYIAVIIAIVIANLISFQAFAATNSTGDDTESQIEAKVAQMTVKETAVYYLSSSLYHRVVIADLFREKLYAQVRSISDEELHFLCVILNGTSLYRDVEICCQERKVALSQCASEVQVATRQLSLADVYAMLNKLRIQEREMLSEARRNALNECYNYMDDKAKLIVLSYTVPSLKEIWEAIKIRVEEKWGKICNDPLDILTLPCDLLSAITKDIEELLVDCKDLITLRYPNSNDMFNQTFRKYVSVDDIEEIIERVLYQGYLDIIKNRETVLDNLNIMYPVTMPGEYVCGNLNDCRVSLSYSDLNLSEVQSLYHYREMQKWGSRAFLAGSFIPKVGNIIFACGLVYDAGMIQYMSEESRNKMATFEPKLKKSMYAMCNDNVDKFYIRLRDNVDNSFDAYTQYIINNLSNL